MFHDIAVVMGLVLAVLVLPVALAAWSDQRPPRAAAVIALAATLLLLAAKINAPNGYGLESIAEALFRLMARVMP